MLNTIKKHPKPSYVYMHQPFSKRYKLIIKILKRQGSLKLPPTDFIVFLTK